MSDTRFAAIDPRRAECRHPDEGFQLPTLADIYHLDRTTIPTVNDGEVRISAAISALDANPDLSREQQSHYLGWIYWAYKRLTPREAGIILDEAQTLYCIAQELHDCLQRALDTLDVEDRLDALASAQASQDGLEGVDVVEAVGEQLITAIREREEPETW